MKKERKFLPIGTVKTKTTGCAFVQNNNWYFNIPGSFFRWTVMYNWYFNIPGSFFRWTVMYNWYLKYLLVSSDGR